MPFMFLGGTTTLSADSSGTIRLRIPVNGTIDQFLVKSSGRVKVTDLELSGYEDIFDGTMELDQFKKDGNTYDLPEPIPVTRGQDLVISLTDISGSTNVVAFAVRIKKA